MTKAKRTLNILVSVLLVCFFCIMLTSCGQTADIDTSGMLLVVYDGNGGYLGNKTAMVRKLYAPSGSKIPDYPADYTTNQYTVPSLGLAMREGYQLLGWYANADYTLNPAGDYLKLEQAAGNGIYELSAEGEYVKKYISRENGPYVYISFEEPAEPEEGQEPPVNTYIFLKNDPETPEEERFALTNGAGFYICNGEETFMEIDDDLLRTAYQTAYETKQYSENEAKAASGYLIYDDLDAGFKELFDGIERYVYTFGEATEADAGLDRYHLTDGYIYIYSLFIEDEKGEFVEEDGQFVKAAADAAGQHYSLNDTCVFSKDTTAGMDRYDGAMEYWDFANDRVTEDKCVKEGEGEEAQYVMTLYAHWEKKASVNFHYNNGTGQVDVMTRYLLSDNITYTPIASGKIIGKKEIVPAFAGHTFVGWSKSEEEYEPWNFDADLFPEGTNELDLYAFYVEGQFERLMNVSALEKIGKNPEGRYLLVGEYDLEGKSYKSSPFGLAENSEFTGELVGVNAVIRNFTVTASGKNTQATDPNMVVGVSLIPAAKDAVIKGISFDFTETLGGVNKGVGKDVPIKLFVSGLIGTASGKTEVSDCSITVTAAPVKDGALTSKTFLYKITVADIAAFGNVTVKDCTSAVDTGALTGTVEITERMLAK